MPTGGGLDDDPLVEALDRRRRQLEDDLRREELRYHDHMERIRQGVSDLRLPEEDRFRSEVIECSEPVFCLPRLDTLYTL